MSINIFREDRLIPTNVSTSNFFFKKVEKPKIGTPSLYETSQDDILKDIYLRTFRNLEKSSQKRSFEDRVLCFEDSFPGLSQNRLPLSPGAPSV